MRTGTSQKGAAVVEFALLALLLLVFVFGIIEFGLLWMQSHYIANAAREGARVASKLEDPEGDPLDKDKVETAVRDYLKGAIVYSDTFVDTNAGIDVTPETIDPDGAAIEAWKVTVTMNTALIWEPVLWPLLDLLPGADVGEIRAISDSATFPALD